MTGLRPIGVLVAVVASTALLGTTASAAPGLGLTAAVTALSVADEVRAGYDRSAFKLWVDADRDGCNTRAEVLLAEAKRPPAVGERCSLIGGLWTSVYDGKSVANASGLDIDHLVPLAEAWDSGARAWTAAQRQEFANDLGDPRSLVAVSASSNRSKGARDPAEWLPTFARCTYVVNWVAVKTRWQLTIDQAERSALLEAAEDCDKATVAVTVAPAAVPTSSAKAAAASVPDPIPTPAGSPVHYANCAAARAAGAAPLRASDPGYRPTLDGDRDGIACEDPKPTPKPAAATAPTSVAAAAAPAASPAPTPEAATTPGGAVYYANCAAVRAAGAAPLRADAPGYRAALDGDKDGVACE